MTQALVATVMARLAVMLLVRAAGLIVTAVLGVIAAAPAASGKGRADRAGSAVPERTVENVKADVAETKERTHR